MGESTDPGRERVGQGPASKARFRIVRLISSGGMGVVYEAEQKESRRTVALKVMKQGLQTHSARQRFAYEARILARLDHPGIAQVIEAGAISADIIDTDIIHSKTQHDEPYLVMEFIPDAHSIIDYARGKGLSLDERLALFHQVCEAVEHGHQKGIIHRDLKPDNILVDGQGRVKIIDFGVARATDADIAATTVLTETGRLIGTIRYMSPEQCETDPLALDLRSDVYTLGVVLFELLLDTLPYTIKDSNVFEAARIIREEPPKRPSQRDHSLRGDLETMLLKTLEKEPEARYQTVAEFGEDIRRYRCGEVIRARPAGPAGRLWKWGKRNPKLSLACVAVILSAVSFLGYALFYAYPKLDAEREKVSEAYARILRLSDVKRVTDLEKEAMQLWPALPDKVPRLTVWIEQAEALLARKPLHRQTLATLASRALPDDEPAGPTDGTGIGGDLLKPKSFADLNDQWEYDTLLDLLLRIETMIHSEKGELSSVKHRLTQARTIQERSIDRHQADWERAVNGIADRQICPAYDGLVIKPQLGLVPLGPDPVSGLWEFGHLETGELPRRGEDGILDLTEESGLVLILIPGGTFRMGTDPPSAEFPVGSPNVDPASIFIESPAHTVTVDPYFISKYEMTQGQWVRSTRENPSHYSAERWVPGEKRDGIPHTLLLPVEQVSWDDCTTLLRQLNLRLPSEAEWELAARAGTTTIHWRGNTWESLMGAENVSPLLWGAFFPGKTELDYPNRDLSWDDGYPATAPVGRFLPNPFGLYDVMGNIGEWCRDNYCLYQDAPLDGSAFESPDSTTRMARWGGRSAVRSIQKPGQRDKRIGVRPAASLQGE